MTKIKQTETHVTNGKKTTMEKTKYYEVGAHELQKMLREVEKGGNEEELRKQLIAESTW